MFRHSLPSRFPTTRRVTAIALALLLPMQTTACVSEWHPITTPIPTLTGAKPTDTYRVTLIGGEVLQITKLRVRGDSLFGRADSVKLVRNTLLGVQCPVGVPVWQVARVERHSLSAWYYLAPALEFVGLAVLAMAVDWWFHSWVW
jgi:hypothetical protein